MNNLKNHNHYIRSAFLKGEFSEEEYIKIEKMLSFITDESKDLGSNAKSYLKDVIKEIF